MSLRSFLNAFSGVAPMPFQAPEIWTHPHVARQELARYGHKHEVLDAIMAKLDADAHAVHELLLRRIPFARERPMILDGMLCGQQWEPFHRAVQKLRVRRDLQDQEATEVSWDEACGADFAVALLGFPGAGKSFTVMKIIQEALDMQLEVAVFTPAAKLLGMYETAFGDRVHLDTVHAGFGIPVGDFESLQHLQVKSALSKFHLIVVDEISMLSKDFIEFIVTTWQQLAKWFVLIFVGDFCQLEPIGGVSRIGNALSSKAWLACTRRSCLKPNVVGRCKDPELLSFLEAARHGGVSRGDLRQLQAGRALGTPTLLNVSKLWRSHPKVVVLCWTNAQCKIIHDLAVQHLFSSRMPDATLRVAEFDETTADHDREHLEIFMGSLWT